MLDITFGITGIEVSNSAFPETLSGKPITSGERFDEFSGGVFLTLVMSPMSIKRVRRKLIALSKHVRLNAVSPGVSITLKDGSGQTVFYGNGPYVAISETVANYVLCWQKWLRSRIAKIQSGWCNIWNRETSSQ